MATHYPTSGDINLPSSSSNYSDIYITNANHTYNNFNGNGTQSTATNPSGQGSGATYEVTSGTATFLGYFNINGSNVIVDSGAAIKVDLDYTNAAGGHLTVNGSFTVKSNTNLNQSVITVNSGGKFTAEGLTNLNSGYLNINGGTIELKGHLANNDKSSSDPGPIVDFNNNPNGTFIIDKSSQTSDAVAITVKNYTYGDTIKIGSSGSGTLTTSYDSSNHTLTVLNSSGKEVVKFTNFTDSNYSSNPISAEYSDGFLVINCFLPGSLISTPYGTKAVEELSVGDEIIAYVDGVATPRRVTWTGQAHCNVRSHLPDDEAGYPVRILKDAISDGVPFKDMLITAEHCLFFDGKFVPARMLVNGRSIFFDKSVTSYDYYHIETEAHSVVMADGMLTESYLDTGNRRAFSQKGNVVSISSSRNLTWDDAAAPLGVSREFAEPLFRQAEARAIAAGITQKGAAPELTEEANLHLITDTGVSIRPAREHNGRIMFMIPTGVQSIRIASNASRPSDVVGPFIDDRRYFGVAVGDITLFEGNRSRTITSHLTVRELDGWNTLEWEDCRWTSGNGLLPLGERHPNSVALIAIQIRKTGPYLATDAVQKKAALRA
ncbi:outer membrane protein (plasmid) [Acetobacter pasteurianus NBRC 101655]|uniref:Hint domain-containing protein n=1 Tax=Acetobacter pasteurianus TaxID=438 RepID=UPI0003152712|nr:Hint domain-containing protein [Acetobacter pasteurianus]BAU39946.1 outer membrane protein [Acetobacter pasteurianus NBRC 101655]